MSQLEFFLCSHKPHSFFIVYETLVAIILLSFSSMLMEIWKHVCQSLLWPWSAVVIIVMATILSRSAGTSVTGHYVANSWIIAVPRCSIDGALCCHGTCQNQRSELTDLDLLSARRQTDSLFRTTNTSSAC